MEKLFELLGLGAPFAYGAATYAFFHWLDASASDEAKEAFARLLDVRRYDRATISAAIIELFDRVYTHPLLARRAFFRSAAITFVFTSIYLYEVGLSPYYVAVGSRPGDPVVKFLVWSILMLLPVLVINILTDFISLFVVRRWLIIEKDHPVLGLIGSFAIFVVVIGVSGALRLAILLLVTQEDAIALLEWNNMVLALSDLFFDPNILFNPATLMIPALVVFIWLPLFGVSLVIVRAFNVFIPLVIPLFKELGGF